MSEVNEADLPIGMLKPDTSKHWKWSIDCDEHLDALLDAQGIEDPDEQALVCSALCAFGLAEHKMFSEHTDTLDSQESSLHVNQSDAKARKGMAVLDKALVREPLIGSCKRRQTTGRR
jgi:hypothetical protein